MAVNVLKLKKRAVELGMSKDDAKKATRPELESFIATASVEDKPEAKKSVKKKLTKKAQARKSSKSSENTKSKKSSSKKSTTKKSGTKSAPAESRKNSGKAKRPASQKSGSNDTGRAAIEGLDWTATSDEWNPKVGGPVERLFKALKKAKGDIDKAFDATVGDLYDFVGKKKRDGSKRTKGEAEAMLRYRLNRTKFEFARRTGQHKSATNRAEYGTGDYATTRKKKAPRKQSSESRKPKNTGKTTKRKAGTKRKK